MAFTYNTVKAASSVSDFTMLDYAEAADGTTVLFHMTRPFSIWPYTMAITGILPEHSYDPASYGANPIGLISYPSDNTTTLPVSLAATVGDTFANLRHHPVLGKQQNENNRFMTVIQWLN